MLETKARLNGFHPSLQVWCFLIDRLIPWRNRMCQGRRLMEQTEFYSPDALSQLKLGCSRKRSAAPLQSAVYAFRFASLATLGGWWGGMGWKATSDLSWWWQKCSIIFLPLYVKWKGKVFFFVLSNKCIQVQHAHLTMTHDNDASFGVWMLDATGYTVKTTAA